MDSKGVFAKITRIAEIVLYSYLCSLQTEASVSYLGSIAAFRPPDPNHSSTKMDMP